MKFSIRDFSPDHIRVIACQTRGYSSDPLEISEIELNCDEGAIFCDWVKSHWKQEFDRHINEVVITGESDPFSEEYFGATGLISFVTLTRFQELLSTLKTDKQLILHHRLAEESKDWERHGCNEVNFYTVASFETTDFDVPDDASEPD